MARVLALLMPGLGEPASAMTQREAFLVWLTCCLCSVTSFARPNEAAEAAIRDGKNSYNSGDYEAAVQSFEQAFALERDDEILYQLGKAYAMADWPVEAVDAFERYVDAAPPTLSAQRRLELAEAIEGQKRRIGTVVLEVRPGQARVTLDGAALDRASYTKPIRVRQGSHVLAASLDGYVPQVQAVQIRGRTSELVRLALLPVPRPAYDGLLEIECQLPEVSVLIDDRRVATTPLRELIVLGEGLHRLRLERTGYRQQTATVRITRTKTTQVQCDLPVAQPLVASGRLELDLAETGAVLLVDGAPADKSNVLPPGLHRVEVRHYGFLPWTRELRVDAGGVNRIHVALTPTPAYVHDSEQRAQHHRTWSYVLGATGIALAGTALGIGLWNDSRYSDWEHERSELQNAYSGSAAAAAELEPERRDVNSELRSIHAVDIATAMLGVAGGMLLGSGALFFFTAEDPQHPRSQSTAAGGARPGLGVNVLW